ncbi:MAG TPA: DUF4153 domain-containing protein [Stenotrophomonas sp.]|nr:DUF4153 domain-containing protein [Stenotrophomonas sp.]
MTKDSALPPQTRSFIVLVALLQGGLLYLAQKGHSEGWWPFDALGGRICWYTLVLGVPCAMTLSVVDLRDRRFWQHAAILFVVFLALAAWAAWNATGAPNLSSHEVLVPFGSSLVLGLFVALPWLQARLASGHWRAGYGELFEHAWQNAITVLLTLLFTGVCWGILMLWAALFALVDITFFRQLFREDAFVHLATGAIVGFGILIARTQPRAVQVVRQLLIVASKGLLPLVAFIALIFAVSLPFTGLAPLWKTRSAASVLLSLVALHVILINAVYQDGRGPRPYPTWLRRVVEAGLLTMPLYATLALVAMGLRIGQYGWTAERFWGALAALVAVLYAFGYALVALRPREGWLAGLSPLNCRLSWVVMALVLLVNSPVLDPWRIVVSSQVARMRAAAPEVVRDDAEYLRFDTGRRGYQAVQALRNDPLFRGHAESVGTLQRALDGTTRWGYRTPHERKRDRITDPLELQRRVELAKGSSAPDAAWWQELFSGKLDSHECRLRGSECVLVVRDLDGDGSADTLLCDIMGGAFANCMLHTREDGRWRNAGRTTFTVNRREDGEVGRMLRAGELHVTPRRWPDLAVGAGKPQSVTEIRSDEAAAKANP